MPRGDRGSRRARPKLIDDVMLVVAPLSVVLSDSEAAVARPLVERFGQLVLREELADRAFGPDLAADRTLDARVHRLRRRIRCVGLTVLTVRGQGFILDHEASLEAIAALSSLG